MTDMLTALPTMLDLIDYFGIAVFAISGALTAALAGFALRGMAIARGWSLPAYRD